MEKADEKRPAEVKVARRKGEDADSWVTEYKSKKREIARTYAGDPKDDCIWVVEYDSTGRIIARTYADDPKNAESWRKCD